MMHNSSTNAHGSVRTLVCGALLLSGLAGAAWAQTIKLTDETTFTADILQNGDDGLIVRIPREQVATVDGQPLPPIPVVGAAAPTFTATDLSGAAQTVGPGSDHVTLLHFWVHWCPHCRSDAPQVQVLHDKFRNDPRVKVVTVNLDQERAKVEEFIQEHQVTYPVILASDQAQHGVDLTALYQITGFPVTFLIDEQGMIRHKTIGSFVESHTDLDAKITELLPQTPPPAPASKPAEQKKRKKGLGWW